MTESIVVTGYGMTTPLGAGSESTWKALMGGHNPSRALKGQEWKAFEYPRAAQALEVWVPQNLIRCDRSLQLGAVAAEEAWKMAGLYRVPPGQIGTTFSSSKGGILSLLQVGLDPTVTWDFLNEFFPHACGLLLAQRFGFSGPALSVASACSTGLGSLAMGARMLEDAECDAVIAGSTEASIHPLIYAGFQNMGILTRKPGGSSPFDFTRDGFLMGEGSAALVLEREKSAKKRKAPLLARVSGWALGADATAMLEMELQGDSIVKVVERTLQKAGLKPTDIGYINAHGTGTLLNDRIESKALNRVFGDTSTWVSSTKGATGHLLGAAGSVEAVLSIMALRTGELPETRNLENPDPECRIRHVERGGVKQKVEHVLSLSYGFGGQLGAVIFSRI
jgi:3-oxoacyl-[acyl-carrier-protein] synthase II